MAVAVGRIGHEHRPLGASYAVQQSSRAVAVQLDRVVSILDRPGSGASGATRTSLQAVAPDLKRAIAASEQPPLRDPGVWRRRSRPPR
jgi:hypothetical protein